MLITMFCVFTCEESEMYVTLELGGRNTKTMRVRRYPHKARNGRLEVK